MNKIIYGLHYYEWDVDNDYEVFYVTEDAAQKALKEKIQEQIKINELAEKCDKCEYQYTHNIQDVIETCPYINECKDREYCEHRVNFSDVIYTIRPKILIEE